MGALDSMEGTRSLLRSSSKATSNFPSSSMYSLRWACGNSFPLYKWERTLVLSIPASGPVGKET